MPLEDDRLRSLTETAAILRMSPGWLKREADRGSIPSLNIGTETRPQYRFDPAVVWHIVTMRARGFGTPKVLVTLPAAAKQLGLHKDWLRNDALSGRVPSYVHGEKKLLLNVVDVEAAIEEEISTSRRLGDG